ncbi:hypothetical protein MTBLM5_90026 [Magnetospirillum sp. LM-5]|nr:hypothetical protein MTBLM5_90026 [Magnetospirillum sp. LM-5]
MDVIQWSMDCQVKHGNDDQEMLIRILGSAR